MSNNPVICISNTTWHGGYTKSTVQLMSILAGIREVLFVEYPFTFKDIASTFINKQNAPVKKMLGMQPRLTKIQTAYKTTVNHLVMPPVLPVDFIGNNNAFDFFFRYNTHKYKKHILETMIKLGFIDPVVVTAYNPFYGLPMIGQLNEACNIYYCYDGIGTRRHGIRIFDRDKRFSEKVDAIITSSNHILQQKSQWNKYVYTVTNGVDFQSFKPYARKIPANNLRPKAGYLGSMDHRFDIDTVEYAVKNLPGYDFEFVGSLRNEKVKQVLSKYSNARFSDPVPPDKVPELMASCNVGIIPYQINEINKNIYPLKINEYLAVGVPVVMTAFAQLPEFTDITSQTTNPEIFTKSLISAIDTDNEENIRKRISFAQQNDWRGKTREFNRIISETIKRKQYGK